MPSSARSEPAWAVTLVVQTRVLAEKADSFAEWQARLGAALARVPGFLGQVMRPPVPPEQLDWVLLQRFDDAEATRAWLQSPQWRARLTEIQPALVGSLDVHLLRSNERTSASQGPQQPGAPVSVLISTRVKAGQEAAFLRWQKQIAAAEAGFQGFQGYKIDPPIAGLQDDWTMIVRFDSDEHLDAWLTSDQRKRLLEEAAAFDERTHVRKVGTGFESWFAAGGRVGERPPPSWKQNAIVLLMLYPFIFLFDALVQRPILQARGMPFWLALFVADVLSVPLLGYLLVPQANKLFRWWLKPGENSGLRRDWAGAALMLVLYGVLVLAFERMA